ncbi:MAG: hypothetical protein ONB05_10165 [candidate division KSB1 bacterium]|nr:hypothetical protein [candidate division KSB1 bacterium]
MKVAIRSLVFFLIMGLLSCQGVKEKEGEPSRMTGTVGQLVEQLKKRTDCIVLGEGGKSLLVITPAYGARVIAASVKGLEGENLLWANSRIATEAFWTSKPAQWNLGGARTWIAPEDIFYLDKQNNWFVPAQMDPGNYQLVKREGKSIVCANEFALRNKRDEEYQVKITRTITLLDEAPETAEGLGFVGLQFTHELENLSNKTLGQDVSPMGLWSLIQINPSGTIFVPVQKDQKHGGIIYRDYGGEAFNVIPPERLVVSDEVLCLKVDGKFRCKLGIAPWACKNGLAYLSYREGAEGILYLKQFEVEPEGMYLDHPWGKPSDYGDAIQMYNDDGKMGGFAEMECHAPAKALAPGEKQSHTITFTMYTGELETLKKIAGEKLSLDMGKVTLF